MSLPLVPLDNVPAHGLTVQMGAWAQSAAAEALAGRDASVRGTLEVRRVARDLHVQGTLSGTAGVNCDRCGVEVPLTVTAVVDCLYAAPRSDDETLPEDAYAEIGDYDGATLDMAHVVGESLALERPARVRCADVDPTQDDACLARWRDAAGASASTPDPRLAALAGFKTSH
jgi:uncharacterized metal-binding protein YceD (DUF177 family)